MYFIVYNIHIFTYYIKMSFKAQFYYSFKGLCKCI